MLPSSSPGKQGMTPPTPTVCMCMKPYKLIVLGSDIYMKTYKCTYAANESIFLLRSKKEEETSNHPLQRNDAVADHAHSDRAEHSSET